MPTKAAFDVNFLDRFHAADAATREALFLCIEVGELEMYATLEMLREAMGLARTRRKDLLVPFAQDILRLTRGKVLMEYEKGQQAELRGEPGVLMAETGRQEIVRFLEQTAGGHVPSAAEGIGLDAIETKRQFKDQVDAWYEKIVAEAAPLTPERRKQATYQGIVQRRWENVRRFVRSACDRFGIENADEVADRVANHPENYPRFVAFERAFAVVMHRYFIEESRRDAGDLFDYWQMCYLADMDVFVTNEKKLPGWYEDAFPTKRVMTAEGFLSAT